MENCPNNHNRSDLITCQVPKDNLKISSFKCICGCNRCKKIVKINIDGIKLNKIIKNNDYRVEVLDRLKYADIILKETKKELEGTNFLNLIYILKQSLIQLENWIKEEYGEVDNE